MRYVSRIQSNGESLLSLIHLQQQQRQQQRQQQHQQSSSSSYATTCTISPESAAASRHAINCNLASKYAESFAQVKLLVLLGVSHNTSDGDAYMPDGLLAWTAHSEYQES
jgi:hypothetical protein